jgi:hypothetical protein
MAWGWDWLETFLQDAGYGLRSMLRTPAITVVALTSLALGIGANTAIFSFLDAMMLRSLPVRDPQQLVKLGVEDWGGITDGFACTELYSYPFYRQFQRKNAVFSDTAAAFSMMNDAADPCPDRFGHVLSDPRRGCADGPCAERRGRLERRRPSGFSHQRRLLEAHVWQRSVGP